MPEHPGASRRSEGAGEPILERPIPPRHTHRCAECKGDWVHEGRCRGGRLAWCPWCLPGAGVAPVPGTARGAHLHRCPACVREWRHADACTAPLRTPHAGCLARPEPAMAPAPGPVSRRSRETRSRRRRRDPGFRVGRVAAAGLFLAVIVVGLSVILGPRRSGFDGELSRRPLYSAGSAERRGSESTSEPVADVTDEARSAPTDSPEVASDEPYSDHGQDIVATAPAAPRGR